MHCNGVQVISGLFVILCLVTFLDLTAVQHNFGAGRQGHTCDPFTWASMHLGCCERAIESENTQKTPSALPAATGLCPVYIS